MIYDRIIDTSSLFSVPAVYIIQLYKCTHEIANLTITLQKISKYYNQALRPYICQLTVKLLFFPITQ